MISESNEIKLKLGQLNWCAFPSPSIRAYGSEGHSGFGDGPAFAPELFAGTSKTTTFYKGS